MHSNTAAHTEGNQSSHFLSHCLGFQGKRYVSVVSPFLSNTCSDWTLSVCFWRKRRLAHMIYKHNCKHDTVEWITVTLTSGHLDFCQNVFKKGHIFPPSQFSQAGVSWSDLSKLWKKKNDACSNRLLVFANSLSCEKKKTEYNSLRQTKLFIWVRNPQWILHLLAYIHLQKWPHGGNTNPIYNLCQASSACM